FGHAQAPFKDRGRAVAPVVEVPRDDDRHVARGELLQPARDRLELAAAAALVQREMHANEVQIAAPSRDRYYAVQQSAPLEAVIRHVVVLERDQGIARKDRVAVMAVV